jgi:hypothetical protein
MTKQEWHSLPNHRVELAKIIESEVFQDALGVLGAEAMVTSHTADITNLALRYKHLEGYQAAINDLLSLSQPPKPKAAKIAPFAHMQKPE